METDPSFAECLAWLLELRLKVRGNREALAIVDQCLALCARARTADADTMRALDQEVRQIGERLALRFGAPRNVTLQ